MGDEFRDLLRRLNQQAKELQADFLRLKEDAADAKKRWEAKVTEIQQAIDEDYPLFDGQGGGPSDSGGGGGGGGGDDGPRDPGPAPIGGDAIDVEFEVSRPQLPAPTFIRPVPPAFQGDAWRSETIASLVDRYGFSEKTRDLLDEAGIRTIGALADWNREINLLTAIPGIGEAKAAEIEEVMDQFWADWARRDVPKSGGDLVTSRPGTWTDDAAEPEKPKKSRKKSA